MTTGIYTLQHVWSEAGLAFKPPSRHRPGMKLLPLRHMKPCQLTETTRVVVRVTHREPFHMQRQQARRKVYSRVEYRAHSVNYGVATVAWQTGVITTLEQYATKREAVAAL